MIKDVRAFKVNENLAPNAPVKLIIKEKTHSFDSLLEYLKRFTFANEITITKDELKGGKIYNHFDLLVEQTISDEELKLKLETEIEKLKIEIKRSESMLNNENFLLKAKKEKVELEKNKYQDYLNKLNAYLDRYNKL